MSMTCPNCDESELVGFIQVRERCIDVLTGAVMRDEVLQPCVRYECGNCQHEWPAAPAA